MPCSARRFASALLSVFALALVSSFAPSAMAAEMKVGPEGQIIVDGKPVVMLGVWQQTPNLFAYHKSLGMNALVVPPADVGRHSSAERYLEQAGEEGLGVILSGYDKKIPEHPALWGWSVGVLGHRGAASATVHGRQVRQADPKHLAMVNMVALEMIKDKSNDAALRAGLREVDAVVSHVWPEMFEGGQRDLRLVGDFVDRVKELSAEREGPAVSIWPDINPHEWRDKGGRIYPAPTRRELRFQTWLALIHGADGLCFFTISFDPFVYTQIPAQNEKELIYNARLIKRLTPVLTAPPSPLPITVGAEEAEAIVDFTTRSYEGSHYVFMLNGQNSQQTVTLKLDGLGTKYRLLNVLQEEAAEVEAQDGQYQERLPGLDLRIWKIEPVDAAENAPATGAPAGERPAGASASQTAPRVQSAAAIIERNNN